MAYYQPTAGAAAPGRGSVAGGGPSLIEKRLFQAAFVYPVKGVCRALQHIQEHE
jgi:hypothetical protein